MLGVLAVREDSLRSVAVLCFRNDPHRVRCKQEKRTGHSFQHVHTSL